MSVRLRDAPVFSTANDSGFTMPRFASLRQQLYSDLQQITARLQAAWLIRIQPSRCCIQKPQDAESTLAKFGPAKHMPRSPMHPQDVRACRVFVFAHSAADLSNSPACLDAFRFNTFYKASHQLTCAEAHVSSQLFFETNVVFL